MNIFVSTICAAFAAAALCACSAMSMTPSENQVAAIQGACAFDAGLRPTVTALMALPGLAAPADQEAVTAARAIIDPVCANPSGSLQTNTITVFSESTAQIANIVAELQSRKATAAAASVPGAK